MNEAEVAEQFNKELEGVLRGGRGVYFSPDPGAMELASALARADFSGGSAIKESLRARLAGGYSRPGRFAEAVRGLLRNVYARAALAAACLLLALLPLARRSGGPGVEPVRTPISEPGPAAGRPESPAAAAWRTSTVRAPGRPLRRAAADPVIFNSIPMARLEGEPIRNFPIGAAGGGAPIVLIAGREVKLENGSGLVFETGSGVFTLERRVITPEDIFERRVL